MHSFIFTESGLTLTACGVAQEFDRISDANEYLYDGLSLIVGGVTISSRRRAPTICPTGIQILVRTGSAGITGHAARGCKCGFPPATVCAPATH